ncbi:AAA family ATPase [Candidatus Uabimicrobium amorphum]|uniref:Serine/threonine protein kinase n=1 Tax=Uabimicrobium amorphum TaxID=2596890 RepID=A0A5S9F1K7_UABAM|nr:AAA family ATPase [Candidatus Uabimicrobium amorphum]BBM82502.1 serine/threonine protein kinase [Candidatus Uabimicrobium amorphum]
MSKEYKKIEELKPAKLTARDKQFSSLKDYLEKANNGEPNFVLLHGEQGLGKTRLKDELNQYRQAKFPESYYFEITCEKDDLLQPFLRIAQTIFRIHKTCPQLKKENHVGTPGGTLDYRFIDFAMSNYTEESVENVFFDVESDLSVIYKSICGYIRSHAQQSTLCFVIEDIHFIDRNSADFLIHFLNDIDAGDRLLFLFCYHGDESSGENGLQRALPTMFRTGRLKEVKLSPFLVRDIPGFIQSIVGENVEVSTDLATMLYKNSNGNPYRIQAFVQDFAKKKFLFCEGGKWSIEISPLFFHQIPKEVEEMLISNLAKQGKYQQEILRAIAMSKRSLDSEILSEVTGLASAQLPYVLEELTNQKYIFGEDSLYSISSENISEEIIKRIEEKQLIKAYLKMAKIIEKKRAKDFPFIADLYFEAQEKKKLLLYAVQAGEMLYEQGKFSQALDYYTKVLPYAQVSKKSIFCKVLIATGLTNYQLGNYKKALENFSEAKGNATAKDEQESIARGKGLCLYGQHKHREARDALRNLQKKLSKPNEEIFLALASLELEKNNFGKANGYLNKYEEISTNREILKPMAMACRGALDFYFGKWEEAQSNLEMAMHSFKEFKQTKEFVQASLYCAEMALYTKNITKANELLQTSTVKELKDNHLRFCHDYLAAFIAMEAENKEKAVKLFNSIRTKGNEMGDERAFGYGTYGLGIYKLVFERKADEAYQLAAKALEYANNIRDSYLSAECYHLIARANLQQKNFNGVQKYVEYSRKAWKSLGASWKNDRVKLCFARLFAYTRNTEKAIALMQKLEEKAQQMQDNYFLADVYFEYGMVQRLGGKKDISLQSFKKSVELNQKLQRSFHFKRALHLMKN